MLPLICWGPVILKCHRKSGLRARQDAQKKLMLFWCDLLLLFSLFGGVDRFVAVERGQNFCPIQFWGTLAPPRCLQKCWYCF